VEDKIGVFLDTSALFSAVHSETGGARLILKLGEAGAIQLWVGPWVLREAESVIERKSPKSKAYFALLLDRSNIKVGEEAGEEGLEVALAVVDYLPDAQVVAEALEAGIDYFVSFDRKHMIENPRVEGLPFPVGTAGDFLAWYRGRLTGGSGQLLL
jgi:predicted nucleic acid-binding protein